LVKHSRAAPPPDDAPEPRLSDRATEDTYPSIRAEAAFPSAVTSPFFDSSSRPIQNSTSHGMAEAEQQPRSSTPEPDAGNGSGSDSSAVPSPPPRPVPAADPRLQCATNAEDDVTSPTLAPEVDDVFRVPPRAALRLLSAGIEALVNMTGDIPPTPPPQSPSIPHMTGIEAEKKSIVRSNSEKSLARLAQQGSARNSPRPGRSPLQRVEPAPPAAAVAAPAEPST
jgi:hypothetical protein